MNTVESLRPQEHVSWRVGLVRKIPQQAGLE